MHIFIPEIIWAPPPFAGCLFKDKSEETFAFFLTYSLFAYFL